MLKALGLALGLAVVGLIALAALQPAQIQVSRSIRIAAPPERVYPLIADLHGFNRWNPWAKMDPAIRLEYRGPASGVGATSAWTSEEVGSGSMTIVEARAPEWIAIRLDFLEPFEVTNGASFSLTRNGDATEVLWEMEGPASFVQRLVGVFVDVEAMMGETFEAGLADLRRLAEQP